MSHNWGNNSPIDSFKCAAGLIFRLWKRNSYGELNKNAATLLGWIWAACLRLILRLICGLSAADLATDLWFVCG